MTLNMIPNGWGFLVLPKVKYENVVFTTKEAKLQPTAEIEGMIKELVLIMPLDNNKGRIKSNFGLGLLIYLKNYE